MVHDDRIDFERADVLTAANDQFLQPSGQPQIACIIHDALVAGAEPAIGECLGVGFRIRLIALRDVAAPDDDFTERAGGSKAPLSSMIPTSGPAAMPTDPG